MIPARRGVAGGSVDSALVVGGRPPGRHGFRKRIMNRDRAELGRGGWKRAYMRLRRCPTEDAAFSMALCCLQTLSALSESGCAGFWEMNGRDPESRPDSAVNRVPVL
ncbi:hypothetical protein AAFF_G00149580 [Aldrovandia affinis]|uniref:Uncharacterized protein n=1 Tax=Aldrovandia affinis TaxID=143900 RepID=A0AAD7W9G8_9TELE|nr:hypothetical protein AAFF_G00149580 [Aldrovandia affinis]